MRERLQKKLRIVAFSSQILEIGWIFALIVAFFHHVKVNYTTKSAGCQIFLLKKLHRWLIYHNLRFFVKKKSFAF